MWVVRIEADEDERNRVETIFLVNTETGERDRQERLGSYLDELRQDPNFDEDALIEIYISEAQARADLLNRT